MTMNFGVLWIRSGKPLDVEIQNAVEHIKSKYGATPNLCLMSEKDKDDVTVQGIEVRKSNFIQAGHLWLGGK